MGGFSDMGGCSEMAFEWQVVDMGLMLETAILGGAVWLVLAERPEVELDSSVLPLIWTS
jgi:hypothetical protein